MTKVRVSPHGGYLVEGAISSGTLRTQDLLRAFADELERLNPFNSYSSVSEARDFIYLLDKDERRSQAELVAMPAESLRAEAGEVVDELADELSHLAAPHSLYFGTTEGDGACFGFWKTDEEDYDD